MQQSIKLPGDVTPQKFEKRKNEIQIVLDEFFEEWHSLDSAMPLNLIENAAAKITLKYFTLSENVIKIYLPKKSFTNKFKVAAGSELAVMFTLPIRIDDPNHHLGHVRDVNSRFAIRLAFNMVNNVHFEETGDFPKNIEDNNYLARIIDNHRLWLSRININNIDAAPTFITSNFWEAFFYGLTGTL